MTRKMTEWPSKRRPLAKIGPSDGCKWYGVLLAVDQWYDFHEFGCHLGNVGLCIYEVGHTSGAPIGPVNATDPPWAVMLFRSERFC